MYIYKLSRKNSNARKHIPEQNILVKKKKGHEKKNIFLKAEPKLSDPVSQ